MDIHIERLDVDVHVLQAEPDIIGLPHAPAASRASAPEERICV
jgi:hypothetical protein